MSPNAVDEGAHRLRPEQTTSGRRHFGALDGIRGLGALVIVVYHTFYLGHGYLAVDLFVMLSGVVIAQAALDAAPRPSDGEFARRRIARLYPLHLFALAAYALCYFHRHGALPSYRDGIVFTLVQQATLLHCVGFSSDELTWNFPAWAVSVEFWVNVVAFGLAARRVRTSWLVLIALLCYVSLYNAFRGLGLNVNFQVMWGWLGGGLVRGLGGFALGWIVYRVREPLSRALRSKLAWSLVEGAAFAAVAVAMLRSSGAITDDYAALPALFALVAALTVERGLASRLLRAAPFQFLGRISYGVFLLHIPVQEVMYAHDLNVPTLGAATFVPLYVAAVAIVATIAHYGIEAPARRLLAPRSA